MSRYCNLENFHPLETRQIGDFSSPVMTKRAAPLPAQEDSFRQQHKRQKFANGDDDNQPLFEEITSSRQLHQLLAFRQDDAQHLRYGIQSLKVFLDSILYPADADKDDAYKVERKEIILEEFLKLLQRHSAGKEHAYLTDVMQTWSFASMTSNEHLISATTAVLALLLKVVSSKLELREYGSGICNAVLQPSQLKCVARSLSAPKHKEFIISPALRLLTEIVSFDGGVFAARVYSNREFTFDPRMLARNISGRESSSNEEYNPLKPTLRSNALRYLLANLRFQDGDANADIMKHGSISRAFFSHMSEDAPSMIRDILYVLKAHVVLDQNIARSIKTFFFDVQNLVSILAVCRRYYDEEDRPEGLKPIQSVAYDFLLLVCTTPDLGVHLVDGGWYPPGIDYSQVYSDEDSGIDLGLDSIDWYDEFKTKVPVKNTTLASLIHIFRPYASEMELDLLLAIFKAAPELVADYFYKKVSFSFDPNLTATWIGYASFLFSTIQLPVPKYFGKSTRYADVPPPVSLAMESILPLPLTQKVLTKCLNQNSELISFFVVRLLTVAFRKLKLVLQCFDEAAAERGSLWREGRSRIVAELCQRCPKMKDVILRFRRIPESSTMQREAVLRLLSLYYDTIPQIALEAQFDVAVPLTNALQSLNADQKDDAGGIKMTTLDHILRIAQHSPDMLWWRKPNTLRFTPFTTLLRLAASTDSPSSQIMELLKAVVNETEILQMQSKPSGLSALLASLVSKGGLVSDEIFDFLDASLIHFVRRPIKYDDDMDAVIREKHSLQRTDAKDRPVISLLLAALVEQLPFVEKASGEVLHRVVGWLARLLNFLRQAGEDQDVLTILRYRMCQSIKDTECIHVLDDCFDGEEVLETKLMESVEEMAKNDESTSKNSTSTDYSSYFDEHRPPKEITKYTALTKASRKAVEEVIDEGAVELISYLSSTDQSMRLQATNALYKIYATLPEGPHPAKEEARTVLGELLDTRHRHGDANPLPHLTTSFAARALAVATEPAHFLYVKVNEFLNAGPAWKVTQLPSTWADAVLGTAPTEDDKHWAEVDWFLDWIHDGLRTPDDMNILRRCGTFEVAMALCGAAYTPKATRERVLGLLARATWVEGASTTMVTKMGAVAWLGGGVGRREDGGLFAALLGRVWETCDRERVREWSGGMIEKDVQTALATSVVSQSNCDHCR